MESLNWFFLEEPTPLTGAENMARDQYLLELVEEGVIQGAVLRVYRWDPPALSLGYHQRWENSVVQSVLEQHSIDLVRRWTGGRAVLHIRELTYSVIAPFSTPFKNRVLHNYDLIARALKAFTDRLFLDVSLAAGHESHESPSGKERSTPCFASLSPSEIQAGKRKLIGSAQKLGRRAFLQHGSLPLEDHADLLCELTGSTLNMEERMVTLGEMYRAMNRDLPDFNNLATEMKRSFEDTFGMKFSDQSPETVMDQDRIAELVKNRFGHEDWTYLH